MANHFTQAQAATVQDDDHTFCTPPTLDVKSVRVPPADSLLGKCAHFDALGHALVVPVVATLNAQRLAALSSGYSLPLNLSESASLGVPLHPRYRLDGLEPAFIYLRLMCSYRSSNAAILSAP